MDYEKDLEIDGMSLDLEWIRQPKLFAKYSKELAEAERKAKLANELVKTIRSELIMKINKDPDTYLGKDMKVTDAKVEACYRQQDEYKKAKQDRIDAEYTRDMIKVAADAFNFHRKPALENLVTLHGQQYFAGPSVPNDIGREFAGKAAARGREQARDKTAERTGRRS